MISGLGSAIGASYRTGLGLFASATGLWIGVAALEALQHGVEWHLGMFASDGNIEAALDSHAYRSAGYAKVAAVMVCGYLVSRYLYQGRDWRRVLRADTTLLKGIVVAIGTQAVALGIPGALTATMAPVDATGPTWAGMLVSFVGLALMVPLMAVMPWAVGLIAGDHAMTLGKSIRAMRRRWIWATLLVLGCYVPVLIPHLALNMIAIGTSPPAIVLATLLLTDSVLTGFAALLLGSSYWIMYRTRVLDALT